MAKRLLCRDVQDVIPSDFPLIVKRARCESLADRSHALKLNLGGRPL